MINFIYMAPQLQSVLQEKQKNKKNYKPWRLNTL